VPCMVMASIMFVFSLFTTDKTPLIQADEAMFQPSLQRLKPFLP
jgi:hypothetical protein